jgi:hypothetical protein
MKIHFPLLRHSRAGGNPAKIIFREAAHTSLFVCYAEFFIGWIPSCAAMTALEDI